MNFRTLTMLVIVCSFFLMPDLSAQAKYTISGYLRDAATGEELLYATVLAKEVESGTTTNLYGFYSLTLPEGTHTIEYSYVGYEPQLMKIELKADVRKDLELGSAAQNLVEVVVKAKEENENIRNTETGTLKLDVKDMKLIPVLMGEQDIIKSMQLMPGVSSSGEGGSGFFVRGGNLDQNLILLDEAPVYNASHLLGFFSVFNSDALKDVKMYKSGIPAEYGGRASSVMDVRMKNGNTKGFGLSGGLGLISSRLTVEGPIVKENGSFIISGRRTYLDLILRNTQEDFEGTALFFYDLNAKANYKFGKNDRLYLSGYFGKDKLGTEDFGFDWGNKTATLRWNHLFNDKLFSNTSFIFSDYSYGFEVQNDDIDIALSSGILDYNFKQDFNWYINPKNSLRFGINGIYHKFEPGAFTSLNSEGVEEALISIQEQQALEGGVYLANEQKINDRLTLNYGLRMSLFSNVGPYVVKEYNEDNEEINATPHSKGDFYHTYSGWEPRISGSFLLDTKSSVKASYNRIYQYLHLLSNSTSGTPTDIWTPSSPLIKPQIADQFSIGYFKNFKNNQFEFSVEAYYKKLDNQLDYEDGASVLLNEDIESELVFGKGRSYGAEVLLRKTKGRLTGWIGYTLSKSEKQFDAINTGGWFSARQDRTHDISLVGVYELSPKITLSANWIYYTGDAVTFPSGKYQVDNAIVNLYSERNGYRMPDYHRMDIGMTWKLKNTKKYESDLNFSIYNIYNRKNAYTINFRESEEIPNTTEAVRLALFAAVPSITWNFSFK